MKHLFEFQSLESRVLFSLPIASLNLTAMGDFNGDHKADEAIVQRGAAARNVTATISLGTGLGLFIKSASVTISNFNPTDVAVGDVNGDGFADVVILGSPAGNVGPTPLSSAITSSQNDVIVLLGNGKGGFKTNVNTATGATNVIETTYAVPLLSASSVAVGDFDGDGSADIAVLGQAVQTAVTPSVSTIANVIPKTGSAIDVLWDISRPSVALNVRVGVSASPITTSTLIALPSNPNVNTLFAGDLDGNGKTDLVAALSSEAVLPPVLGKTIMLGASVTANVPIRPDFATVRFPASHTPVVTVGTNPFDVAVAARASAISTSTEQTIGLGALTSGGKLDLIGLRGNSIVYSAYNPATESFGPVQTAQSKNPPLLLSAARISLADINGDGLPDLLAETAGGTYVGKNTPSNVVNSVLFAWSRVILPPGGVTPL